MFGPDSPFSCGRQLAKHQLSRSKDRFTTSECWKCIIKVPDWVQNPLVHFSELINSDRLAVRINCSVLSHSSTLIPLFDEEPDPYLIRRVCLIYHASNLKKVFMEQECTKYHAVGIIRDYDRTNIALFHCLLRLRSDTLLTKVVWITGTRSPFPVGTSTQAIGIMEKTNLLDFVAQGAIVDRDRTNSSNEPTMLVLDSNGFEKSSICLVCQTTMRNNSSIDSILQSVAEELCGTIGTSLTSNLGMRLYFKPPVTPARTSLKNLVKKRFLYYPIMWRRVHPQVVDYALTLREAFPAYVLLWILEKIPLFATQRHYRMITLIQSVYASIDSLESLQNKRRCLI